MSTDETPVVLTETITPAPAKPVEEVAAVAVNAAVSEEAGAALPAAAEAVVAPAASAPAATPAVSAAVSAPEAEATEEAKGAEAKDGTKAEAKETKKGGAKDAPAEEEEEEEEQDDDEEEEEDDYSSEDDAAAADSESEFDGDSDAAVSEVGDEDEDDEDDEDHKGSGNKRSAPQTRALPKRRRTEPVPEPPKFQEEPGFPQIEGVSKEQMEVIMTVKANDLKEMLKRNNQLSTGTKPIMQERIIECIVNGCFPKCPKCNTGRLRISKVKKRNEALECPGFVDDDGKFTPCGFWEGNESNDPALVVVRPEWIKGDGQVV
ncbi:hypothetical protein HDU98_011395 [Podochytrium sp. JEL0797]|nr:hypothetical protein HDU98_011395 [Podochytrium sp. JEL0797]